MLLLGGTGDLSYRSVNEIFFAQVWIEILILYVLLLILKMLGKKVLIPIDFLQGLILNLRFRLVLILQIGYIRKNLMPFLCVLLYIVILDFGLGS